MANEVTHRNNVDWGMDPFFDNLENRFFGNMMPQVSQSLKTDIQETPQSYICKIDLPGVDKQNIHLNYDQGILNISVQKDSFDDHTDKKGNLLLSERSYGAMSRSFRLPNVDSGKISAQDIDGVLTITLPKLSEAQGNGNIDIQ